ncbi:MAG TPA: 30S ribosomal protein S8 [Candidatus Hydrogenedentes bacterium]|nr:30S ribosomal protein S8 [Candidatus Hydrogenedentota bacterium]HOS03666.1 30S ribosomal protein S8 [Candidatus Hydrogenedentota bacterium]
MSMSDPIADLLSRLRNALVAGHDHVDIPASRIKEEICSVLLREGFIAAYRLIEEGPQGTLRVSLKYQGENRRPVLQGLRRVSRPSLRVYAKSAEVRPVRSGLGISILSTSRGVMTGKQAREAHVGGEILCEVW